MKLSRELNLFVAMGLILVGILFASISIYMMKTNSDKEMVHLRSLLESERRTKLRDLIRGAYSVLDTANFYEPAQKALQDMRFGANEQNYYLVVDTDGMIWVDPFQPKHVGKIKLNLTDADGKPYIRNIIDKAVKQKEGYISYKETPGDQLHPVTRLVYFKYFEKWKWIVCAGMYMNDIETLLGEKEKEIKNGMLVQAGIILGLVALAVLISIKTGTTLISKRIVIPLEQITHAAQRIGMGDFNAKIEVKSNQEINQLADSLRKMQKSLDMAIKRARRVRDKRTHSTVEEDTSVYVTSLSEAKKDIPKAS